MYRTAFLFTVRPLQKGFIKKRGADVMSVEIGPQAREATRNYGFPVSDQPFTPWRVSMPFDGIFPYGCPEYFETMVTYLHNQVYLPARLGIQRIDDLR